MKEKIRVLHLVLSLNVGGAERVVSSLVTDQKGEDIEQSVCCLDQIGSLGLELINEGYDAICLKRKPGVDLKLVWRIWKYCYKKNIDIIHTHGESPWFYGALACQLVPLAKISCITTIHGYGGGDRKELKQYRLWKFLTRLSKKVVCVSRIFQTELESAGLITKKLTTIVNCLDPAQFKGFENTILRTEYGIDKDEFVVGIVARLSSIKNHILLLAAVEKLTRQNSKKIRLVIVGDGPERSVLESEVEKLRIKNLVVFCGEQQTIYKFYKLFDVFVLPSFSEGISMTLLEAMASGVPVIASAVGGNTEIIVHNENGLLFPSNNLDSLVRCINRVMKEENLVKKLVEEANRTIHKKFSLDAMLSAYSSLYREVVS